MFVPFECDRGSHKKRDVIGDVMINNESARTDCENFFGIHFLEHAVLNWILKCIKSFFFAFLC
jgi:UDP-3-O-acyl-N-acetylglucosamine deacetylase